jgi:predicted anti-sigma-YlaC factor YlaD
MRCEAVQDLILTDYLDGEVEDAVGEQIVAHLAVCRGCDEFDAAVHKTATELFSKSKSPVTPPEIWPMIRTRLEKERLPRTVSAARVWERLGTMITPRTLAAASASMGAAVLVLTLWTKGLDSTPVQSSVDPQLEIEHMTFLVEGPPETEPAESFDTAIEEYFL